MKRLTLTRVDEGPHSIIVGRDKDGLGWCMFAGGSPLTCSGCGKRIGSGYMARSGGQYRCEDCVEFEDES